MENITHTLTGLMLSRAGLNRFTPNATAILLLAANAPDVDIVMLLGGQGLYFHHHRGLTHALLMLPVMALLPVLAVAIAARKALPWKAALCVSMIGTASHLLLDSLNFYGVRLLLPFSNEWFGFGTAHVVDAWMLAALFLGSAGPAFSRLVSSEIGARSGTGRGTAIFVLFFLTLYNFARVFPLRRALAVQEAHLYNGELPKRMIAIPGPVNPLAWRGIVEAGGAFYVQDINLLFEFDSSAARVFAQSEPHPAISKARQTRPFQDVLNFTGFGLWRVGPDPESEGSTRVELLDLRFGTPPDPSFYATAVIDASGQLQRSWFAY